jgi:hypothetical protein
MSDTDISFITVLKQTGRSHAYENKLKVLETRAEKKFGDLPLSFLIKLK